MPPTRVLHKQLGALWRRQEMPPGQEHDFCCPLLLSPSLPLFIIHRSPFTWATSLMIAQWLWVRHASFNRGSREREGERERQKQREREREIWGFEQKKRGTKAGRNSLFDTSEGGWKGTWAKKEVEGREADKEGGIKQRCRLVFVRQASRKEVRGCRREPGGPFY